MAKKKNQKTVEMIAYRYGVRDTLKFLAEEHGLGDDLVAWLLEEWILDHKEDLENYKDFNK